MSAKVTRTIWFGNGYGVEYIITDPYTIAYNVVTEKDPTMISTESLCIGSDASHRNAEVDEGTGDVLEGSLESMRDFAVRARLEGISFAEETIIEFKETQDLGTILGEVLESFGGETPTTEQ